MARGIPITGVYQDPTSENRPPYTTSIFSEVMDNKRFDKTPTVYQHIRGFLYEIGIYKNKYHLNNLSIYPPEEQPELVLCVKVTPCHPRVLWVVDNISQYYPNLS